VSDVRVALTPAGTLLMPSWILWLSPVIVAPLLAVLWITWEARPKRPEEARSTVERYDRFRAALREDPPAQERADPRAS
jgi:cytochrome c-type biogenesis protein CcmH/NrfF